MAGLKLHMITKKKKRVSKIKKIQAQTTQKVVAI